MGLSMLKDHAGGTKQKHAFYKLEVHEYILLHH